MKPKSEEGPVDAAIRNSAHEWRLTVDAVGSPLLLVDGGGRVRRLNLAASRLAGRTYRELLGVPLAGLGAGEPWRTAAELVAAVVGDGESRVLAVTDEESGATWDVSASRASGFSAGEDRIIVVARDITSVVRLQESLRRSELMSALGALVAGVAHEVRNPLFGISATLDAFESRFSGETEYQGYLYVLRSQLQRLNQLMQQLLDYGKPPRPAVSPEALAAIVADAVAGCEPAAKLAKVTVVPRLAAGLPRLAVDRAQLVQVLINLLENAVQHSPANGTVEITGHREGEWLVCEVRDAGPGFAAADLPRIFEPFFSRRPHGTGLGLSIVQRIVEQHGGTIVARNRPPGQEWEGGAEIELRLPVYVETMGRAETAGPARAAVHGEAVGGNPAESPREPPP